MLKCEFDTFKFDGFDKTSFFRYVVITTPPAAAIRRIASAYFSIVADFYLVAHFSDAIATYVCKLYHCVFTGGMLFRAGRREKSVTDKRTDLRTVRTALDCNDDSDDDAQ